MMDYNEFLMLLIDIYTKPTYLNKDNFMQVYENLNDKQFSTLLTLTLITIKINILIVLIHTLTTTVMIYVIILLTLKA